MTKKERKEYMKKYHEENKEKLNNRSLIYRKAHKESIRNYKKKYDQVHKEEISRYGKKYVDEHYKEIIKGHLEYSRKFKERIHEWNRKSYIKNRDKRIKYQIDYNNRIENKILMNLRIRLWKVLKGINKSQHTLNLLGCSIEFLKKYLESKFTLGMSFSNYGKWHIDHIRPCASFDLSKSEEQYKCFHYTNLQPLWAYDNLSKNDKVTGE